MEGGEWGGGDDVDDIFFCPGMHRGGGFAPCARRRMAMEEKREVGLSVCRGEERPGTGSRRGAGGEAQDTSRGGGNET